MKNFKSPQHTVGLSSAQPQSPRHKKARLSQPNLFSQHLNFQVHKNKEQSQQQPIKQIRQPRTSQIFIDSIPEEPVHFLKSNPSHTRSGFLSPSAIKQQKLMLKSPSTAYLPVVNEVNYGLTRVAPSGSQPRIKKNPIESHKQTLSKIEEMLINHGININVPREKKEEKITVLNKKSPRFSECPGEDTEYRQVLKQKQCESFGNTKKYDKQDNKNFMELKDTVSTHSSVKKIMKIKIDDFDIVKDLGKGKFGTVKLAVHKKTGMLFSLKVVKKSVIKKEEIVEQMIKEIKIQSFLNHVNIVKLYSVFDDSQNIYLLTELCMEGNLYQLMQKDKVLSEPQTKVILRDVCEAVYELHQNSIIHRDLKPQNVVLSFGMSKLCDFGWSTQIKETLRQTFCGTPLYVSPELLSGHSYDQKVDLWAIGILGYEMLTGKTPFDIKTQRDLSKIVNSKVTYPKTMSKTALLFLDNLLQRDPNKRKNIRELLLHPFLQKKQQN